VCLTIHYLMVPDPDASIARIVQQEPAPFDGFCVARSPWAEVRVANLDHDRGVRYALCKPLDVAHRRAAASGCHGRPARARQGRVLALEHSEEACRAGAHGLGRRPDNGGAVAGGHGELGQPEVESQSRHFGCVAVT
jgi:hypothetical protein